MNFSVLFEKEDYLKFNLLTRLTSSVGKSLATEDIYSEIDLSQYRLEQVINELNQDLSLIEPSRQSFVDFSDKAMLQITNLNSALLQKVGLHYIKNSTTFLVLQYMFFFDKQMTKTEYRDQYHLGKTTFYKAEAKIRALLNENDFYAEAKANKDFEYKVRLQLFQLYYQIYNGLENPFPEIDEVINDLTKHLKKELCVELKPTQLTKFSIFSRVWLLRMNNTNLISTSLLAKGVTYPKTKELNELMEQDLKAKLPTPEIEYFYAFLLSEGILPGAAEKLSDDVTSLSISLTNYFMETFDSNIILLDNNDVAVLQMIENEILNLNLQFFTFYNEPSTFISLDQAKFFEQTYPLFDLVINKFIDHLKKEQKLKLSQNDVINLYFSYMFIMITAIPQKAVRNKVYICVDFSQGVLYSNYIKQTLKSFQNAHIVINDEVSPATDIYLSDFPNGFIDAEQIIWQNPPTPNDWSLLGDEIIRFKHENLDKLLS